MANIMIDHASVSARAPTGARRPWKLLRGAVLTALVAVAAVHPLATVLARWDWRADVLTPFGLPALAVTLLALLTLAIGPLRGRRWLMGPLVALAAWQVFGVLRNYGPNPVAPDPARPVRLRILVANVLESNTDHAALAELIRRERPDVVGLIEVTPDWIAGLERCSVRGEFGHRLETPTGFDGLALWLRRAESGTTRLWDAPGANPAIEAQLRWAGRELRLWLVHPVSPFHSRRRSLTEVATLGQAIGRSNRDTIIVGDLNRTDGSPHFRRFLEQTGTRDSRHGFGTQASWPTRLPYRIAIDHAFVSPGLAVTERRLGPPIGSDHLPFVLEVAPSAATKAVTQPTQSAP